MYCLNARHWIGILGRCQEETALTDSIYLIVKLAVSVYNKMAETNKNQ